MFWAYQQSEGSSADEARQLAREVVDSFELATSLYDDPSNPPFVQWTGNKLRFHRLRATTTLVTSRLTSRAMDEGLSLEEARELVHAVDAVIPLPNKQQTRLIWKYQAEYVMGWMNRLRRINGGAAKRLGEASDLKDFLENMEWLATRRRGRTSQKI